MASMDLVKKRIIISMSALVILILTLVGITYAYFSAQVKGNNNDNSISVTAGSLRLEYNDEDSTIVLEKIKPGNESKTKVFSVTNTGTHKVDSYDVYLENVINELKYYEDLTYELTCEIYNTKDYKDNKTNATKIGECNGNKGFFPKYDNTIVSNGIDVGVTHYYTITVKYNDTHTDQSEDMNKNISAKVNIKDDEFSHSKFNIYGNSEVILADNESETSPITPSNYNFLGTLINDKKNSEYGNYKIDIIANGKNLINVNKATTSNTQKYNNFGITQTRTSATNEGYKFSIPVIKANTPIYISFDYVDSSEGQKHLYVRPTDVNGTRLSEKTINLTTGKATVTWNADINKLEFFTQSESAVGTFYTVDNLMIRTVGDSIFEPYIDPITYPLYINEPLRCIDDVCDHIDLINKKVYRKIGFKEFDGTENWVVAENNVSSAYSSFALEFDINKGTKILNTHFNTSTSKILDTTNWANTTDTNNFIVTIDNSIASNLEEWKEWLRNNKPIVYYQLNNISEEETINFIESSNLVNKTINVSDGNLTASNIEIETVNNFS